MMRTLAKIALLIALIVVASRSFHLDLDRKIFNAAKTQVEKGVTQLRTIEQKLVLPPPLYGPTNDNASILTIDGIISITNANRQKENALPLKENPELTKAAEAKIDDMFTHQYFEHVSPAGVGVDDLAVQAGYDYLVVGENLALGNYENDRVLVQAWMDSPGHRENIMNSRYTEIGVAIKRGMFEGRMVWLAVQEFGRPASLCPSPSLTLKTQIDTNKKEAEVLEQEITMARNELNSMRIRRGSNYSQKVDSYNALVQEYNTLISATKEHILVYNSQVSTFNLCIQS